MVFVVFVVVVLVSIYTLQYTSYTSWSGELRWRGAKVPGEEKCVSGEERCHPKILRGAKVVGRKGVKMAESS